MSRYVLIIAAAALAFGAGAVQAADWGVSSYEEPVFKPAYPVDYTYDDPLTFEAGLRYFYGTGGQRSTIAGLGFNADDSSHFLELHGRIDDRSTSSFVSGHVGYAAIIDGTYRTPTSGGTMTTDSGRIAYGAADFGYLPLRNESFGLGGFIGYQYLNESIDMGRASFMTGVGGGDSQSNLLEVHGLRLGVTAEADINDVFDVRINAAAIPYASLTGTYGAFDARAIDPTVTPGNAASISGHLYGGAVDAMIGFSPTPNVTIRAGARGYYLTGPTETYFEVRDPSDPSRAQGFISSGNTELFRWGPVVELTASF